MPGAGVATAASSRVMIAFLGSTGGDGGGGSTWTGSSPHPMTPAIGENLRIGECDLTRSLATQLQALAPQLEACRPIWETFWEIVKAVVYVPRGAVPSPAEDAAYSQSSVAGA